MQISFAFDDELVQSELKQARKQLNAKVKEGLIEGGTRHVLPSVLRRAPSVTRPFLTAKATSRQGYIGTKGSRQGDRITGLLNYGGVLRKPIAPKTKQALSWPGAGGRVTVGAVTGPRTVTGKHFIEAGVEDARSIGGLEQSLLDAVMDAFGELAD